MDPIYLPGVLLLDGHGYPNRSAAVDAAVSHLAGKGVSEWDIDLMRPNMNPARAWYDDAGEQFVQEHHDNARPVTAVHLAQGVSS